MIAVCANLFLCVSSFNTDAPKFYLTLGYEQIGVLKDYLVEGHDEILILTMPMLLEVDILGRNILVIFVYPDN